MNIKYLTIRNNHYSSLKRKNLKKKYQKRNENDEESIYTYIFILNHKRKTIYNHIEHIKR